MKVLIHIITFVCICYAMFSMSVANLATKYQCSAKDSKNIKVAISQYLNDKKHSAIPSDQWDINPKRCVNDYALAIVHPKQPVTDDGFAYLQKVKNKWQVMSIGTHFDEEFLKQIPIELRDYPNQWFN